MADGSGNPFTPGEANPFTPDRPGPGGDGPMAGGEASPSAVPLSTPSVPETTKPRQMPGGDSGGGMDMGMGGDPSGAPGGGSVTDTNVPQQSAPPMDKAATLRRITADILVTNPHLSTRQAQILADEVVRRYPKVATTKTANLPPWGDLNDPLHPWWQQAGGHPYYTQQRSAPGGRNLQAHPQSQYPYVEDAFNRATEWGVNKVKDRLQQRKQRTTAQPPPTPQQGSQPAPAAPRQTGWGTPAPAPAPAPAGTPPVPNNGWGPPPPATPPATPQPTPAPAPQPNRAQQLRNRFTPRGRHAASLVYGPSED